MDAKLYLGDCRTILEEKIQQESIDLIFADPPYNLSGNGLKWQGNQTGGDWFMVNELWDKMTDGEYWQFTYEWIKACTRVLNKFGSLYIACSYHNMGEIIVTLKKLNYKINNIITWQKTNAMPNMTRRVFTHSSEFVVWAVRGSGWTFNYEILKEINPERQKDGSAKQMRDIWKIPLVQGKERLKKASGKALHPTQKPEEMLKRIVLASSNEGDLVLDPFLGSGTSGFIAVKYNRKFIGIEKDKSYLKAARTRIFALGK